MSARPSSKKNRASTGMHPRTVQSVDRAVAIVETLAEQPAGCSLSELANKLGLAAQTLQSLLRTLQHHGWVAQDGRGQPYRIGAGLAALHRRHLARQDRAALAAPAVTELSRTLREYVILDEWSGGRLNPLIELYPDRELSVRGQSFSMERLHTMATGKMLLACLDEAERRRVVAELPLEKKGPRSVTDATRLLKQLTAIDRRGYAFCREESSQGVVALAVPVTTGNGSAPAALGAMLPLARYTASRRKVLMKQLQDAAESIARTWGELH